MSTKLASVYFDTLTTARSGIQTAKRGRAAFLKGAAAPYDVPIPSAPVFNTPRSAAAAYPGAGEMLKGMREIGGASTAQRALEQATAATNLATNLEVTPQAAAAIGDVTPGLGAPFAQPTVAPWGKGDQPIPPNILTSSPTGSSAPAASSDAFGDIMAKIKNFASTNSTPLLIGGGVLAGGLGAKALWDAHQKKKEQEALAARGKYAAFFKGAGLAAPERLLPATVAAGTEGRENDNLGPTAQQMLTPPAPTPPPIAIPPAGPVPSTGPVTLPTPAPLPLAKLGQLSEMLKKAALAPIRPQTPNLDAKIAPSMAPAQTPNLDAKLYSREEVAQRAGGALPPPAPIAPLAPALAPAAKTMPAPASPVQARAGLLATSRPAPAPGLGR